MKEKVLSVFIDESGDFGQYNPASPYYYVAMVLHDQDIDISKNIESLERQINFSKKYKFPIDALQIICYNAIR